MEMTEQDFDDGAAAQTHGATDDATLDQIMQEAENNQPQPAEMVETPKAEPQDPMGQEFEYKANGQMVKEPLSQILKRASMGYHYAQQMEDFNKQKASFDEQQKQWAPKIQLYEQVDKWAQENPERWQQIEQAFQQQNLPAEVDENLAQALTPIQEQLNQFTNFMKDFQTNQEMQRIQAEDQSLNEEVTKVKDQYKDLDWETTNDEGKTLEQEILEHADKNGIPSFKAAFSDLYLPKLLARAKETGKDEAAKRIQQTNKMGILGQTPTPTKAQPQIDPAKYSYNQLQELALAELEAEA